jgi:hypothetical protein
MSILNSKTKPNWRGVYVILGVISIVACLVAVEACSQKEASTQLDSIAVGMEMDQVRDLTGWPRIKIFCDGAYAESWHHLLPANDSKYLSVHFGGRPLAVAIVDTTAIGDILGLQSVREQRSDEVER